MLKKRARAWVFFVVAALLTTVSIAHADQVFKPIDPAVQAKVERVEKEVARGGHTFSVGYSSAMEKDIGQLCGLREPPDWGKSALVMPPGHLLTATALPSSYDWRSLGGTTPIKNQGVCGDCWAFGTIAPLESQIQLKCGATVDLSEQYLTSCNTDGWGCNGGWWGHDYHLNKSGLDEAGPGAVLESAAPFKATDTACGGPYKHIYKISNWAYLAGQDSVPTVQAIKQALYTYGPIAAAVHVGPQFQAYTGGVFNSNESGQVNHAIALVGWIDDIGPDNGYWILRNSWGTSWGEGGYMRIRYGCNQVGYSANYVEFACATPSPTPPPAPALADLSGSWSTPTLSYKGKIQYLNSVLTVSNAGSAAAGAFKVTVYISYDGVTKNVLLGTANVSGLAAGASTNLTFTTHRATGSFSGRYVLAVIDSDGVIKESSESNNSPSKLVP